MKQMIAGLASLVLGLSVAPAALAQQAPAQAQPQQSLPTTPPPQESGPAQAAPQEPGPAQAAPATQPAQAAAPASAPPASWVYSYPTGQWVYTADRGWLWVPAGTTTTAVEGVPYAYMYTPAFGWTWYISPWGWGPYRYGGWVAHPWHPAGWRGGWVAHPHVVHRLGGPHFRR